MAVDFDWVGSDARESARVVLLRNPAARRAFPDAEKFVAWMKEHTAREEGSDPFWTGYWSTYGLVVCVFDDEHGNRYAKVSVTAFCADKLPS